MPYIDPEEQAKAMSRYYVKHRDSLLLKAKLRREKLRAATQRPAPQGNTLPRLTIPPDARWRLYDDRIYFTTVRGFTLEELEIILTQIRPALKSKVHRHHADEAHHIGSTAHKHQLRATPPPPEPKAKTKAKPKSAPVKASAKKKPSTRKSR